MHAAIRRLILFLFLPKLCGAAWDPRYSRQECMETHPFASKGLYSGTAKPPWPSRAAVLSARHFICMDMKRSPHKSV